MKKIVIFLLLVLSVCVFGKTEAQYKPYLNLKSEANRNPTVSYTHLTLPTTSRV